MTGMSPIASRIRVASAASPGLDRFGIRDCV